MKTFALGFLIVFGAVDGMEDPANSLVTLVIVASAGLGIMLAGLSTLKNG